MAEAAGAEAKPVIPGSTGPSTKIVILVGVLALLVGVGAAASFFQWRERHRPEGTERQAQAAVHGTREDGAAKGVAKTPGTIYDMDSFIVNLADAPEVRYLKLTIKLELERPDVSAEIATRLPQVRDAILILLSSKDAASLRTTQGKFQLRDEIVHRVNALLPRGGTRTVYFTEFVVQ